MNSKCLLSSSKVFASTSKISPSNSKIGRPEPGIQLFFIELEGFCAPMASKPWCLKTSAQTTRPGGMREAIK